jgi:hypothetical protein
MPVPYNLFPWMCMKKMSFILSLVIPGLSSPGMDIGVYLQPLIDKLQELWNVGVRTFDVSKKDTFNMRAQLMWTINDFLDSKAIKRSKVKGVGKKVGFLEV